MRRFPLIAAVSLLAACSQPAGPAPAPSLSFSVAGGPYAWSVANGAKGGLILARETAGGGQPVLVLTCDDLRTGGLQASLFTAEPMPTLLELTAGGAVMTAPGRPGRIGGQAILEGEGPLPPDWARALGAAGRLKLRYGDQGIEVQGPTPAQAAAFGDYCRELAARRG